MLSMRCALRVDATRPTRFLGQRPRRLLLLTLRPRQPDVGDGVLLELIARAAEREGGLTAYGPPDFQFRIARVAGANHLAVSFADAELEKARQAALHRRRFDLGQRRPDLVHQVALGIGLLKDLRFVEFPKGLEIAIAGHEDDRQSGLRGVDGSYEFNAIHFRHSKVCKNEIYLQLACDQPKRFPSALGWDCCISEKIERRRLPRAR
jgi:hypothetical protein